MHTPHVTSGGRYPVLRALAILYVLGSCLAILSVLAGIVWIFARAPGTFVDHLIMSVGAAVGGFVMVVSLLAVAELLKLFIDVEHNTRMAIPGRMGMPMSMTTAGETTVVASSNGGETVVATTGTPNRIAALDEETAEAALIRGH
jgi:hypothetical protein